MVKREKNSNIYIVTGGQSGVDRAALDFAMKHHISCGGWCPKGRLAEDGIIDIVYPLKECSSSDPSERTRLNIEDSDGVLIIMTKKMDGGTSYAHNHARSTHKPVYIINSSTPLDPDVFDSWIETNRIFKLNIVGSRESNDKGIYEYATQVLEKLFFGA